MITPCWCRAAALTVMLFTSAAWAYAIDGATAKQLGAEDGDAKLAAIQKLVATGDAAAIPILKALQDDILVLVNGRLAIVEGSGAKDALSGEPIVAPADKREAIMINNRIRAALDGAIAALKLVSSNRTSAWRRRGQWPAIPATKCCR